MTLAPRSYDCLAIIRQDLRKMNILVIVIDLGQFRGAVGITRQSAAKIDYLWSLMAKRLE
jgi:hypothetical protein